MHRQSLGSPTRSAATAIGGGVGGGDSLAAVIPPPPELKSVDAKSSRGRPDRSIHLIPVLLLSCLLLLYLLSHDPSPTDMASFSGGAAVLVAAKAVNKAEKAGAVRGLKEAEAAAAAATARKRQLSRKLGTRL